MNSSLRTRGLRTIPVVILAWLTLGVAPHRAAADHLTAAEQTVALYQKTDPNLARFFESSAGYAVFSNVGKGGVGFGGAYGAGVLYQQGRATGRTSLTQATIGLQLGAQTYSEIIFFESEQAVDDFKRNQFAFSAQVSAVALHSGASANASYRDGVAVFTAAKHGMMLEGSVGGQRFGYKPFKADASK
jgi:lipid-binding SYLF domain-containing protein